jgi:hypothetical protein
VEQSSSRLKWAAGSSDVSHPRSSPRDPERRARVCQSIPSEIQPRLFYVLDRLFGHITVIPAQSPPDRAPQSLDRVKVRWIGRPLGEKIAKFPQKLHQNTAFVTWPAFRYEIPKSFAIRIISCSSNHILKYQNDKTSLLNSLMRVIRSKPNHFRIRPNSKHYRSDRHIQYVTSRHFWSDENHWNFWKSTWTMHVLTIQINIDNILHQLASKGCRISPIAQTWHFVTSSSLVIWGRNSKKLFSETGKTHFRDTAELRWNWQTNPCGGVCLRIERLCWVIQHKGNISTSQQKMLKLPAWLNEQTTTDELVDSQYSGEFHTGHQAQGVP